MSTPERQPSLRNKTEAVTAASSLQQDHGASISTPSGGDAGVQTAVRSPQSPVLTSALHSKHRTERDMTPSFSSCRLRGGESSEEEQPTFRKYVDQLTVKLYVDWDGNEGLRIAPVHSWQRPRNEQAQAFVIRNTNSCVRGIKKGDFLIEIGSHDVRKCSFREVQALLKESPKPIHLVFERKFKLPDEINFENEHYALHELVEQARELIIVHGDHRQIESAIPDQHSCKTELNDELQRINGEIKRYNEIRKKGYEEDFFLKSLRDEAAELRSRLKRATDEKKQLAEEVKNTEKQKELTLYASKGVEAQVQQMAHAYRGLLQESSEKDKPSETSYGKGKDYCGWGAEQITALKQLEKIRAKLKAVASSACSIQQDRSNAISAGDRSQRSQRNKCRSLWFFMDTQCKQSIINLANQVNQMATDYWFLTFQDTADEPILSIDLIPSRLDPGSQFKNELQYKSQTDMGLLRYAFRVIRCNTIELAARCKSTMTAISEDIAALVDNNADDLHMDWNNTIPS
eukprot:gb/GECG01010169.1/.p1 GENE.gb/GECG01010169.1/~~gb/GECG01010169.1/.p1  ORF type:complete len:516 (+),score=67.66 gb/GECG01010169.1/:1-1548(+)